jgi:hypothetical protein
LVIETGVRFELLHEPIKLRTSLDRSWRTKHTDLKTFATSSSFQINGATSGTQLANDHSLLISPEALGRRYLGGLFLVQSAGLPKTPPKKWASCLTANSVVSLWDEPLISCSNPAEGRGLDTRWTAGEDIDREMLELRMTSNGRLVLTYLPPPQSEAQECLRR